MDIGGPAAEHAASGMVTEREGISRAAAGASDRREEDAAAETDSMFVPVEIHSFEPGAAANGVDEEHVDVVGGAGSVPDAIAAMLHHQPTQQEGRKQ